jgi:hypothetical protein
VADSCHFPQFGTIEEDTDVVHLDYEEIVLCALDVNVIGRPARFTSQDRRFLRRDVELPVELLDLPFVFDDLCLFQEEIEPIIIRPRPDD